MRGRGHGIDLRSSESKVAGLHDMCLTLCDVPTLDLDTNIILKDLSKNLISPH